MTESRPTAERSSRLERIAAGERFPAEIHRDRAEEIILDVGLHLYCGAKQASSTSR
jgi:hypothetical protein